jgi:hypothetical protein
MPLRVGWLEDIPVNAEIPRPYPIDAFKCRFSIYAACPYRRVRASVLRGAA